MPRHRSEVLKPQAGHPAGLTPEETKLYADLVASVYGDGVRLEQERAGFGAIERALI